MKQVVAFLKTKGFYIALGTGLVAFAGLMALYDYKGDRDSAKNEQAIDLNQPVQSEDARVGEEKENIQDKVEETAGPNIKTTEQQDDSSSMQETVHNHEQEAVAGTSDAQEEDAVAITAAADEPVTEPEPTVMSYDGSQVLAWPLVGTILLPYSMDQTIYFETLNCYRCNPGIMIEGSEDTPVYAVYDGTILSVEESKEYGTTITLDLGNGYQAIYGQLKNIAVKTGDVVERAQPIGEVAKASTYYAEEGNHLYFAMTKDGEPIDPTYCMQ